jgi:hypothetical protein
MINKTVFKKVWMRSILRTLVRTLGLFASLGFITTMNLGCDQKKKVDELLKTEAGLVTSGDIVVSSAGTRDVKVFSSLGLYKATILDLDPTTGQVPFGLSYNSTTREIFIAVDGPTNRAIKAYRLDTGTLRDFSLSPALNSSLRGLSHLPSGDLLMVIQGGNRVERIDGINGSQVQVGGWPKALQTTGTGVHTRADGSFVHCSVGSDVVRTYDPAGNQTATVASGLVNTTDVMDCKFDENGNVYAAFNGTTDTIRKMTNTLATTWSYSNIVLLPNPTALAVRTDGRVLAVDASLNYVVEILADGSAASVLGYDADNMISNPTAILVVP